MLFGNEKIQKQIIEDAKKYANEHNFELVYGAMVGGISRGLQYADSDYDTRFLYFDKENSNRMFFPWEEKEDDLKHRMYFDESKSPYEWIPLWEITSFFQFLKKPAFDNKVSYGLYNVVGWTLQSPYAWDPYGLQMKLMPLVNKIFRKEMLLPYHVEQIKQYWSCDENLIVKDYLYAIYAALAIKWVCMNNSFNPIYMKTMILSVVDSRLQEKFFNMISLAKQYSAEYLKSNQKGKMHESHFIGYVKHDLEIDNFITEMLVEADSQIKKSFVTEEEIEQGIGQIYKVINESINNETKVFRVS